MNKIFSIFLIFTAILTLALGEEGYWKNVRIIEKQIFDRQNLYSVTKEDLLKICEKENNKTKKAAKNILPYFDKSETIVKEIEITFAKVFLNSNISFFPPIDDDQFREWHKNRKELFLKVFTILKNEKNLSVVEVVHPLIKMEFIREISGKNIRCALFPYGYSYKCGTNNGIFFAPSLGFCYNRKDCENCIKSIRLEFFGSKDYLIGLHAIRPLKYSENYVCFKIDEKGNVI